MPAFCFLASTNKSRRSDPPCCQSCLCSCVTAGLWYIDHKQCSIIRSPHCRCEQQRGSVKAETILSDVCYGGNMKNRARVTKGTIVNQLIARFSLNSYLEYNKFDGDNVFEE